MKQLKDGPYTGSTASKKPSPLREKPKKQMTIGESANLGR